MLDLADFVYGKRFEDENRVKWIALRSLRDGLVLAVHADVDVPAQVYVVLCPELKTVSDTLKKTQGEAKDGNE